MPLSHKHWCSVVDLVLTLKDVNNMGVMELLVNLHPLLFVSLLKHGLHLAMEPQMALKFWSFEYWGLQICTTIPALPSCYLGSVDYLVSFFLFLMLLFRFLFSVCLSVLCMQVTVDARRGFTSPGAEITCGCGHQIWVLRTKHRSSEEQQGHLTVKLFLSQDFF